MKTQAFPWLHERRFGVNLLFTLARYAFSASVHVHGFVNQLTWSSDDPGNTDEFG